MVESLPLRALFERADPGREHPANRARVTAEYQPPDPRRPRARPDELVCMDSSLEGERFEPSVPRKRDPFKFAQKMQPVRRTHNEAL
jgi:hypothetical protein